MTYNDRVQQQAEIMALIKYGPNWDKVPALAEIRQGIIADLLPFARHAVDLMAQGFDEGSDITNKAIFNYFNGGRIRWEDIPTKKQDLGLIKPYKP